MAITNSDLNDQFMNLTIQDLELCITVGNMVGQINCQRNGA